MPKHRWLLPTVVGALLVFGIVSAVNASHAGVEARLARQATAQALKDATHAASVAATAQHLADVSRIERDSALAKANILAARSARLRASYKTVAAIAPDTCRPIVISADSALAAADSAQAALRVALAASQRSEQLLQIAVDTLVPALQTLRSTATTLVKADTKLARRTLLSRLVPHVGGGIAFGIDATGAPRLITGVTLGWSF